MRGDVIVGARRGTALRGRLGGAGWAPPPVPLRSAPTPGLRSRRSARWRGRARAVRHLAVGGRRCARGRVGESGSASPSESSSPSNAGPRNSTVRRASKAPARAAATVRTRLQLPASAGATVRRATRARAAPFCLGSGIANRDGLRSRRCGRGLRGCLQRAPRDGGAMLRRARAGLHHGDPPLQATATRPHLSRSPSRGFPRPRYAVRPRRGAEDFRRARPRPAPEPPDPPRRGARRPSSARAA